MDVSLGTVVDRLVLESCPGGTTIMVDEGSDVDVEAVWEPLVKSLVALEGVELPFPEEVAVWLDTLAVVDRLELEPCPGGMTMGMDVVSVSVIVEVGELLDPLVVLKPVELPYCVESDGDGAGMPGRGVSVE